MNIDFSLTYNPIEEYNERGYHTTLAKHRDNIIKNGFYKSNKSNEWLGEGVYFWDNEENALWWKPKDRMSKKCIFICDLSCPVSQYLNLDKEMAKFEEYLHMYLKSIPSSLGKKPNFKNTDQCRKFFCDIYCGKNDICILAFTFEHDRINEFGFKVGADMRRQICVKNTKCISIVRVKE